MSGLSTTDALLVLAINQANIAPMTRDPVARSLYGGLDAPARDEQRRPVSVSAIATSLRLPFETARRHVKRLEAAGVCATSDRGVIVPEAFLASPQYMASVSAAHARLHAFYAELQADNLLEPLPASRFPFEEGVPIRAAARLLADYVLRSAELLRAQVGDLLVALILLVVLAEAPGPEGQAAPVSIAAAARRLGMPAETVRRNAAKLVDGGFCLRSPKGLTLREDVFETPMLVGFFHDNGINVQRLFAGLAERGIVDAWQQFGR